MGVYHVSIFQPHRTNNLTTYDELVETPSEEAGVISMIQEIIGRINIPRVIIIRHASTLPVSKVYR